LLPGVACRGARSLGGSPQQRRAAASGAAAGGTAAQGAAAEERGLATPRLLRTCTGLAAAMTEQRACRLVTMPALEMEMDCCSMASWMDTRSWVRAGGGGRGAAGSHLGRAGSSQIRYQRRPSGQLCRQRPQQRRQAAPLTPPRSLHQWPRQAAAAIRAASPAAGGGGPPSCLPAHLVVHLVKLVNEADAPVRQHQRAALQRPLARDGVLVHAGGQAHGGRTLACSYGVRGAGVLCVWC
jgi:hypothetical protein